MDEDAHKDEDEDYQIMRWTFSHDLVPVEYEKQLLHERYQNPGMSCNSLWIPMFVV